MELEIKNLTKQLNELLDEKSNIELVIYEFNKKQKIYLSDITKKILYIDKEIAYLETIKNTQKIKNTQHTKLKEKYISIQEKISNLKDDFENKKIDEIIYKKSLSNLEKIKNDLKAKLETQQKQHSKNIFYEKFEKAEQTYNSFKEDINKLKKQNLSKEEKKELKKLFKELSKRFHPDIIDEEYSKQAKEIIQKLNEIFNNQNLIMMKNFHYSLQNIYFPLKYEHNKDLSAKLLYLQNEINTLKQDIKKLKETSIYQIASNNQDEYLKQQKQKLNEIYHQKQLYFENLKKEALLLMGMNFEIQIGQKYENQGYLVIYNGLIRQYQDKGVDLITISSKDKIINLIQCKNYTSRKINIKILEKIYSKLNYYDFDFINLSIDDITQYTKKENIQEELDDFQNNFLEYKIIKNLYLNTENIIDLSIGKHLRLIDENIFKYKDMNIIIYKK